MFRKVIETNDINWNRVAVTFIRRFHCLLFIRRRLICHPISDPRRFSDSWDFLCAENAMTPFRGLARVETSIIHESDTPSSLSISGSAFLFATSLSVYSFCRSSPLRFVNSAPAVGILVIGGNFSRLRNAPAGVSSESFRPRQRGASSSFPSSRGVAHSSQLDDIRRAKLHFTAVFHLLHDLVTRIVPVRIGASLLVVVLLLL